MNPLPVASMRLTGTGSIGILQAPDNGTGMVGSQSVVLVDTEGLAELSRAADLGITAAYDFARVQLERRYGVPRSATGAPQPLVIVGMGKLGGGELNFSSDIDLVFAFGEAGKITAHGGQILVDAMARRLQKEGFKPWITR